MRWFKHLSDAHTRSSIQQVMAQWGPWGYFAFFVILETIAHGMRYGTDPPSATLPLQEWCRILHTKAKILISFLENSGKITGMKAEYSGCIPGTFPEHSRNIPGMKPECNQNILTITHANLLKYRDEWTRRSGVTREQETETETETEIKKEKEIQKKKKAAPAALDFCLHKNPSCNGDRNACLADFKKFWGSYPRHEPSAKEALKSWCRANPIGQIESIIAWLAEAKLSEQWQDRKLIPYATTWLNQRRWEGDPPPKGGQTITRGAPGPDWESIKAKYGQSETGSMAAKTGGGG